MPVSVLAAEHNHAKAGFDAEDFHRRETTDDTRSASYNETVFIEDRFLKRIDHFTAASPLITEGYQKLYPALQNAVSILNVFPKTEGRLNVSERNSIRPVKLFWFSQTVGEGRGVEGVIEAIRLCPDSMIELHLLGYCSDKMRDYFLALGKAATGDAAFLYFYSSLPEKALFQLAAQFDIGLASETGIPFNREICLTNKVFTYIQAGLAVVASNTFAQQQLLKKYTGIGKLYAKGSPEELACILQFYAEHREILAQHKQNSFALGQEVLNWEKEQLKLIAAIQIILQ